MSGLRPLLALLLLAVPASAATELPSPTLRATGRATIYQGDLAGARDRAVEAALLRGLERYAGLRLEASTLIRQGELIDRELRSRTRGWVRSYEILDSRRDGAEMVVDVELTVADEPVEESFRRLTSATTTLLLVREANLGRAIEGQILPSILADPFFTSRLVTPPADRLRELSASVPPRFYEAADPATVRELGLSFLAGVVVVAWADTRRLDSSAAGLGYALADASVTRPVVAAEGNLAILDGRSGRVLAARRFDDVRGSDACNVERAGREALTRLAEVMRAFVVERLSLHVRELGFPLRIVARGEAAAGGGARVAQILDDIRWVERVERVREGSGEAVLEATCRENPAYVVEELRRVPEIEILRFDADLAELEVR